MSFGPVLQHSLNPSVTLLNWVKVYNAVCTPTPIHRLCTQTFSPPQKTNALLGIEPAAPPPSWSPSRDVNPLHQTTDHCGQKGLAAAASWLRLTLLDFRWEHNNGYSLLPLYIHERPCQYTSNTYFTRERYW